MGHKCSLGSICRKLSTGGTAGPGLISVAKPCAPPRFLSSSQYEAGTHSYGPSILTPETPVTVDGLAVADDRNGLGQSYFLRMSVYICSTSGGGGLLLPFTQTNKVGGLSMRLTGCDF